METWVEFDLNMVMELPHAEAKAAQAHPVVPLARLAKDQILKVDGSYYPAAALAQHREGACGVRARVEADGTVTRVNLTRSSASVDLDTACKEAISAAKFIPAEYGGAPVASSIDVWVAWHLPK